MLEQEQQLLYHKQTTTKPKRQRSERTVSFHFLQLIEITGVLNLFGNPFAKVSLVANGAAFYHCCWEMPEYIESVIALVSSRKHRGEMKPTFR